MSQVSEDDYHRLREEAADLDDGPAKVSLLEQAASVADALRDVDLGFEARQEIIRCAEFCGQVDKMLVAFAWCLGQCDRHPQRFNEWNVLWHYKWAIARLPDFPDISRQRISDALEDMSTRFERYGCGQRAVLKLRYRIAWHLGDRAQALAYYDEWQRAPRDSLTDCPACERDDEVLCLLRNDQPEAALLRAEPILSGWLSCKDVPRSTYEVLLFPTLEMGRLEDSANFYRKARRLLKVNGGHIAFASELIEFTSVTDNFERARRIVDRFLPLALVSPDPRVRFDFHRAMRIYLARAAQLELPTVKLPLPKTQPGYRPDRVYPLADATSWNETKLDDLVSAFNKRNGNEYFSGLKVDRDEWLEKITPLDLSR